MLLSKSRATLCSRRKSCPSSDQDTETNRSNFSRIELESSPMRSLLITGALFAALAAQTPMPRNIAVSRSFGNPGQVGLFIAASDGSDERPLLDSKDSDYDPVWCPDGSSIVFASDRAGSADLFRVTPGDREG